MCKLSCMSCSSLPPLFRAKKAVQVLADQQKSRDRGGGGRSGLPSFSLGKGRRGSREHGGREGEGTDWIDALQASLFSVDAGPAPVTLLLLLSPPAAGFAGGRGGRGGGGEGGRGGGKCTSAPTSPISPSSKNPYLPLLLLLSLSLFLLLALA